MKHILLFLPLLLFSCSNNSVKNTKTDKTVPVKEMTIESSQKKYIARKELLEYVKNIKPNEFTQDYLNPFDSIRFNKVIAYDFDGKEERNISVVDKYGFSKVIKKQKNLNKEQVTFLINFLTDTLTYGQSTAACFEPGLGIVFFNNESVVYTIDICLDCNFLHSTTIIPATQYTQMDSEDGTSYALDGFSQKGKNNIIELCKQLGLEYGNRQY